MKLVFGDPVLYTRTDGHKIKALIIGIRTEPATHIGTDNEPLLSLGYFTPGPVFGTAEHHIVHDVPHASVEELKNDTRSSLGRWTELNPPEQAQAAAAEANPEGWQQAT